jgi:hypothetical protein
MGQIRVDVKTLPNRKELADIFAEAGEGAEEDQAEKVDGVLRSQASKEYKGREAGIQGLDQEWKKLTVDDASVEGGERRGDVTFSCAGITWRKGGRFRRGWRLARGVARCADVGGR